MDILKLTLSIRLAPLITKMMKRWVSSDNKAGVVDEEDVEHRLRDILKVKSSCRLIWFRIRAGDNFRAYLFGALLYVFGDNTSSHQRKKAFLRIRHPRTQVLLSCIPDIIFQMGSSKWHFIFHLLNHTVSIIGARRVSKATNIWRLLALLKQRKNW